MSTNPIFTGAGVAIVTPMLPDGAVNYELLGRLIEFQIENRTDAIIACGTTGESATLNHEEHCAVIAFCVKQTAGRVPVIAGTGSNDTAYALELSVESQRDGADALLMVTPYYNKASQKGLIEHYTYLADRVDLPIILYNVPSRTGVDIKPETYQALGKHPNIRAIKEANANFCALATTMQLCGDDLDVYSGNDDHIVPMMSLGAKGVISVLSNIMPAQTRQMATLCLQGDYAEAAAMQIETIDLVNALFCDVNPIPVKAALELMGYGVGRCRLPLCDMTDSALAHLEAVMKKHNLLS